MRLFSLGLIIATACFAQQVVKPAISPNGQGPRFELGFGTATMKVTADQTGGKWAMVDFLAQPGARTVLHRHPKTDETFYVLEGDLNFFLNGKISILHPGDIAIVPRMTPHAFANLSGKPVRFLGTFTPSGFEKFFALTAEAVKKHKPGTPEFQADVEGIMKKVDMEPLGPSPFGDSRSSAH